MLEILLVTAALVPQTDSVASKTAVISLEKALEIALSESPTVKIADLEIERTGYARKGTYSSLYPTIDGSASFQRTIKKQVMYMDSGGFDISSMLGETLNTYIKPLYAQHPDLPFPTPSGSGSDSGSDSGSSSSSGEGISVGRSNTWTAGVSASMPLVNAQLWKSLQISDQDVELSVEKARSSRLEAVNQVKQAYFAVMLAKDAFEVYRTAYENALANLEQIQRKYNAQKASELELTRAKTTLANAIPSVYDSESAIVIALWQLKAVMGISLEADIDVEGELEDYASHMLYDITEVEAMDVSGNSTLRQLETQAEQLANTIKLQQYANLPSLAVSFAYNINAMANDFKFAEYNWSPYAYAGLSLSIPIFSGGKRASAIKQAQVQSKELELQKQNTERQLKISIRQYLNSMENSMKSFSAAQSAVSSADKAYRIAAKSYDVGRSTLTDLNDAQYALTQAQLTQATAIYNFLSAKADLENIIGADFIDGEGNVQLNKTYDNE